MPTRCAPAALAALLLTLSAVHAQPSSRNDSRPRLQILNGSEHTIDIFWLKSDDERVPNGTVEPDSYTIITTTLGHRFVIVNRQTKEERIVTSQVLVQGFRYDPADKEGIPAFYTQRVYVGGDKAGEGFPIVASKNVNPYALKEAAYIVDLMLAQRKDVRDALIKSGARLCIMAHNEYTTDLPEFERMTRGPIRGVSPKDFWDARARGTGGSPTDPYCTCAEENVLGYPGDPYSTECILIHEFAHLIHLRGMTNVDPTFDRRLRETYQKAMKAGLWKGKYASVNHHEYFAEGVQSWFDDNRQNDHDHNHVNTRAELLEYDPGLAAMCKEVFGDTKLKYTKPATRLTGHMEGYDPLKAPRFEGPRRLNEANRLIRQPAQRRNDAANAAPKKEP